MRKSFIYQLVILMFLLAFFTIVSQESHSAQVVNLIRNGDFEDGLLDWELRQSEGASAEMKEERRDSVKGQRCVFIEINVVAGTSAWHLALYQEGHQIENGTTYTFSCWAKAEELRPAALYVEQASDPWDEYGRIEIQVEEEWQEYWTTFTASLSGPVWPRIALGMSDVNIWVDNVRLYEGDYEEEEDLTRDSAVTPSGKLPITWAGVKEL
jgi:hypothetical protein